MNCSFKRNSYTPHCVQMVFPIGAYQKLNRVLESIQIPGIMMAQKDVMHT